MDNQSIIIQDDIVQAIIDRLSMLRNGQKKYNGIALWAKENAIKEIVRKQEFKDQLGAGLDNHDLRSYGSEIRLLSEEPEEGDEVLILDTKHGVLKVCRIQLFGKITAKFGSLEKAEYVLDWSNQTQWNIGRGEEPSNSYGVDVENYIIIKDDEQDEKIRYINEHVSSFHAKIVYENGDFYLNAEEGGLDHTRLKNSMDKEWNTLRTGIGVPLYDGAHIRLGSVDHYVLLRFKLIVNR